MKGVKPSLQYELVAAKTGQKAKDVKCAVEGIMDLAAEQIKTKGSFKLAGMFRLKAHSLPFRMPKTQFSTESGAIGRKSRHRRP